VQVSDRAATALNDAGITAAVKTALAADPRLSAVKIDVDTRGGVVSLEGPAPDEKSRERAEVLAAAPEGVVRVDNRLVVAGPTQTVGR
jgi:osmotically-inducible protein OsmY